jgi:hypothetical protein
MLIVIEFILKILNWLKNNVSEWFVIPAHFFTIYRNILNGNVYKGIII